MEVGTGLTGLAPASPLRKSVPVGACARLGVLGRPLSFWGDRLGSGISILLCQRGFRSRGRTGADWTHSGDRKPQEIRPSGRSGRSRPQKQISRIGIYKRVDAKCVLCVHPLNFQRDLAFSRALMRLCRVHFDLRPPLTPWSEPHSQETAERTAPFVGNPLAGSHRLKPLGEGVYTREITGRIPFCRRPYFEILIRLARSHARRFLSDYSKRRGDDPVLDPPEHRIGTLRPHLKGTDNWSSLIAHPRIFLSMGLS